jgi:hypothetical protein
MKALTIAQPYASLFLLPEDDERRKRVENRTWPTSYRGLFYIHAGKSREWLQLSDDGTRDEFYGFTMNDLPFGAVIAIAKLVDCVRRELIDARHYDHKYPWLRTHLHTSGPWCWIVDEVNPVGPWPYKGAQGLWEMNERELDKIANRALGIDEAAP